MTRCLACHGPLLTSPAVTAPDRMHGIAGSWSVHQCERCGSGTTLPLATEDQLAGFYPTGYAPFDLPQGPVAAAMRRMQRARDGRFPLAALAAGRAPGTLLDVGCGRGDLAASWIDRGWQVTGIEPSPEAAAVARRRGARVLEGTLDTVALTPRSMDGAVFRHSLEHVLDPQRDLRRVREALVPGATVAVIVPNWGSWQRRAFGEYWFPLELPRHRTHFTVAGLSTALTAAGFHEIVIAPGTPLITTAWSLQFRLFGRVLTDTGFALLAGYAAAVPVGLVARGLDLLLGGGDFLHATARVAG
jgi:SAM-dependent methyltransferase